MKKISILTIMALLIIMVSGCGLGTGKFKGIKLPNACDTIEGKSLLCELTKKNDINLTVLADGLGLANIIAIDRGLYTKEQALKVLKGLRGFMNSPVTYIEFSSKLSNTITLYPYLLTTADRYLNMLVSTDYIYQEDVKLIKGWLDRLIRGLEV